MSDEYLQSLRRSLAEDPNNTAAERLLINELCRAGRCKKTVDSTGKEILWSEHRGIWGSVEKTLSVALYPAPLSDLIAACKYDYFLREIKDWKLPLPLATGKRDIALVQFEGKVSEAQAETCLLQGGPYAYRHATLQELLAIGAQYPDEQKRVFITAFDTIPQSVRRKDGYKHKSGVYIYMSACYRQLWTRWLPKGFETDERVALVREIPSSPHHPNPSP